MLRDFSQSSFAFGFDTRVFKNESGKKKEKLFNSATKVRDFKGFGERSFRDFLGQEV